MEFIAKAFVNKASRVRELHKNRQALEIYDEVVRRFENVSGKVLTQVALALHNKSVLLGELHREDELLAVCDTIIERFSNVKDEMIMNIVSTAQVVKDKEKFNNTSF